MEITTSVWQISLIALAAGALIGALAYRLFAPSVREADQVKSDLDATRDELHSYRASVNEHFDKTAELVNDLTQNYVRVYQHLAAGAQTLGDGERFDNLLEQQAGKVAIAVDDVARAVEPIESSMATDATDATAARAADAPVDPTDAEPATEIDSVATPGDPVATETETVTAPDGLGQSEPVAAADDVGKRDEPERAAATMDPVLNVEALDEAIEKSGREGEPGAMPESKPEDGIRTTTH